MKKMPWVTLRKGIERGREVITIHFYYNAAVLAHLKTLSIARYHPEGKYWYTEAKGFDYKAFAEAIRPVALVNYRELLPLRIAADGDSTARVSPQKGQKGARIPLTEHHAELVKRFKVWMEHKRYSTSTVKTYADAISGFLSFMQPKPAEDAVNDDMVHYVHEYIIGNGYSFAMQNQAVSAALFRCVSTVATPLLAIGCWLPPTKFSQIKTKPFSPALAGEKAFMAFRIRLDV